MRLVTYPWITSYKLLTSRSTTIGFVFNLPWEWLLDVRNRFRSVISLARYLRFNSEPVGWRKQSKIRGTFLWLWLEYVNSLILVLYSQAFSFQYIRCLDPNYNVVLVVKMFFWAGKTPVCTRHILRIIFDLSSHDAVPWSSLNFEILLRTGSTFDTPFSGHRELYFLLSPQHLSLIQWLSILILSRILHLDLKFRLRKLINSVT